jgi:outer membrane scaffolding protein for murein synthesis (MipA/OmpV family)
MKRLLIAFTLCFAILPMTGCPTPAAQTQPTAPAVVAPGYQNAADQQMGEILAGAHAFYNSIAQQAQAGTLVLQPNVKTAFNAFGVTLNSAQTVYLSYHAGAATQAEAQAQVNAVQSQQAALPLPGAK